METYVLVKEEELKALLSSLSTSTTTVNPTDITKSTRINTKSSTTPTSATSTPAKKQSSKKKEKLQVSPPGIPVKQFAKRKKKSSRNIWTHWKPIKLQTKSNRSVQRRRRNENSKS